GNSTIGDAVNGDNLDDYDKDLRMYYSHVTINKNTLFSATST
ncbi:8030_t:CDS:1, partial [Cetraspora pellucida]